LARDFSSSRRAPPIAASKPCFGMQAGAVRERTDAVAHAVLIDVHDQVHAGFRGAAVAEFDHLAEFPGRVHVQHRHRRLARTEGLEQQVQQHRGILADRIQQHRPLERGGDFAQDVDALRFEAVERGQYGHVQCCGLQGRA
jgi:hypothetical protein